LTPTAPWTGAIIGSEIDDAVEKMAHMALTSLCELNLTTTTTISTALFSIHDQEDPDWQQCLEAMCNIESPHFSAGWAEIDKYLR
jgi:hypothetical protein